MEEAKLSEMLFDKESFESHGYEIKIYRMKDKDLKNSISIEPLDPYHPEIMYQIGQEPIISISCMLNVDEIEKIKNGLADAEYLVTFLKEKWYKFI